MRKNFIALEEEFYYADIKLIKEAKKGYILRKTFDVEDAEDIDITDYLNFGKYNTFIEEFSDKFDRIFPNKNKKLFNTNIKELEIEETERTLKEKLRNKMNKSMSCAAYDECDNKIRIFGLNEEDDDDLRNFISHELLHMSSSKDVEFSGFRQIIYKGNKERSFGHILDEGYTEYLNQKYFSEVDLLSSYNDFIVIASGIENIVGQDKMRELYFNADLYGLIKSLMHYKENIDPQDNINEIVDFIGRIDKLNTAKNEVEFYDIYDSLKEEIADMYKLKIDRELELDLITQQEYNFKKYIYVDKYLENDRPYSEDATLERQGDTYYLEDGKIKEYLPKEVIDKLNEKVTNKTK